MKKCPPGVICINNYVICTTIIAIILFIYICGNFTQTIILNNHPSVVNNKENKGGNGWLSAWMPRYPYNNLPYNNLPYNNLPYNNLPNDVLLNPYAPPLRDERYLMQPLTFATAGMVPINMATNVGAVNTDYRQLGFLTPVNNKDKLIPLMGRPLFNNRDKWQYYTMSDQRNSIKLPLSRRGRSCMNEYGCDRLYTGENVNIDGLHAKYKVNMYENDTIKYLPF